MFSHIGKIKQIYFEDPYLSAKDEEKINAYLKKGWELLQVKYTPDNIGGSYTNQVRAYVLLGYPREPKTAKATKGIR